MTTYAEYKRQIAELQVLADAALKEELDGAKDRIATIMRDYNLSPADLVPARKAKGDKKTKTTTTSPIKYADGQGNTWTGRGREPGWIAGKDREALLVKEAA